MIGYFRRQNNWFMALGAGTVLLLLALFGKEWLSGQDFYMKAFYGAIPVFLGVIAGRVFASWWANGRLRQLDELLYKEEKPEEFIRAFAPLVKRAPANTVEYVNGCVKLAYAYEAMGQFGESLKQLEDVKPEQLELHGLAARALVANQKAKAYLLLGDREQAGVCLEELKQLQKTADRRVPALASNLKECVRLVQVWLDFLLGEEWDEDYITEEMRLAKHGIHRGEMGLLLAEMKKRKGDEEGAIKLFEELRETNGRLYAGREAGRRLELYGEIGDQTDH